MGLNVVYCDNRIAYESGIGQDMHHFTVNKVACLIEGRALKLLSVSL